MAANILASSSNFTHNLKSNKVPQDIQANPSTNGKENHLPNLLSNQSMQTLAGSKRSAREINLPEPVRVRPCPTTEAQQASNGESSLYSAADKIAARLLDIAKEVSVLEQFGIYDALKRHSAATEAMKTLRPIALEHSNTTPENLSHIQSEMLQAIRTINEQITNLTTCVSANQSNTMSKLYDMEKEARNTRTRLLSLENIYTKDNNANPSNHTTPRPTTSTQVQPIQTPKKVTEQAQNKLNLNPPVTNPNSSHHPSRLVIQFLPHGALKDEDKMDPSTIVNKVNEALQKSPQAKHIKVVAAKYNTQKNLILSTKADQKAEELYNHANLFLPEITKQYSYEIRVDKKWYKIQIDGIRTSSTTITGAQKENTPESLHTELLACNPYYAEARPHIISPPRWLRTQEELQTVARSSAVFAVDDEDIARNIIAGKTLAIFGSHCTLRIYQDKPPITQCRNCWKFDHTTDKCREVPRCRICADKHSTEDHLETRCTPCQEKMEALHDSDQMYMEEDVQCRHKTRCVNCLDANEQDHYHVADARICPIRIKKYGTMRIADRKALTAENPWKVVNTKYNTSKPKTGNLKKNSNKHQGPSPSQSSTNRYNVLQPVEGDTVKTGQSN